MDLEGGVSEELIIGEMGVEVARSDVLLHPPGRGFSLLWTSIS